MAPARAAALVLGLAALAGGCAFRRGDPLPADPPGDFSVEVVVRDAAAWPWDGRVAFGSAGTVDYDVTFKSPPSNRRGSEPLSEDARREAWAAVVAAGLFDAPPAPEDEGAGPAVVTGVALGLDGRRSGDPAADGVLSALLDALRRAAPPRAFRPLPGEGPPR